MKYLLNAQKYKGSALLKAANDTAQVWGETLPCPSQAPIPQLFSPGQKSWKVGLAH